MGKDFDGTAESKGAQNFRQAQHGGVLSRSYETLKRLILDGFKLNGDSYLKSFRTLRRSGNLTYRMFLTSLRDTATRYLDAKCIDTFEKLMHAFIMEQFLNALPDAVKHFVVSKQPTSVEQAADIADLCYELSRIGNHQNGYGTNVMTGTSVRVGSRAHQVLFPRR